jgi:hypothetical protein
MGSPVSLFFVFLGFGGGASLLLDRATAARCLGRCARGISECAAEKFGLGVPNDAEADDVAVVRRADREHRRHGLLADGLGALADHLRLVVRVHAVLEGDVVVLRADREHRLRLEHAPRRVLLHLLHELQGRHVDGEHHDARDLLGGARRERDDLLAAGHLGELLRRREADGRPRDDLVALARLVGREGDALVLAPLLPGEAEVAALVVGRVHEADAGGLVALRGEVPPPRALLARVHEAAAARNDLVVLLHREDAARAVDARLGRLELGRVEGGVLEPVDGAGHL